MKSGLISTFDTLYSNLSSQINVAFAFIQLLTVSQASVLSGSNESTLPEESDPQNFDAGMKH